MKRLVVGGNFGTPKKSSIVNKLATALYADHYNGGTLQEITDVIDIVTDYDLIVWMPNIENEITKNYPVKKQGSVLICSKLIHDERTTFDAVARIYKMNANAVIAIFKNETEYSFKLIDALDNLWIETSDLNELARAIEKFTEWTKGSIRKNTQLAEYGSFGWVEEQFCEIVRTVSQKVEKEKGGRYFGNASTRCSYMFPSQKMNAGIWVSGRNMPKDFLKPEDFVFVYEKDDKVHYTNRTRKPSVDSPVQLELYKKFPAVKYMIHGHAYIKGAYMTKHYYPCGDMREVDSIMEILEPFRYAIEHELEVFCINLKNHGFLIMSEDIDVLKEFIDVTEFEYREMEEKI